MIGRLEADGYVTRASDKSLEFTPSGQEHAAGIVRRHRLIERFLTDVLKVPWDDVHEEAERLEHAASDELIDRMALALGEPTVDPHGAPIPTRDGAVDETPRRALAELPVGARARVTRVHDEDPAMLRYLAELGIRPGAAVHVLAHAPFDGPITLAVGESECVVGRGLAGQVLVEG
jgi:DtxR family Mn-dependent transcriptional regulator